MNTDHAYSDRQQARVQRSTTDGKYTCGSAGQHRRLMRNLKLRQAEAS